MNASQNNVKFYIDTSALILIFRNYPQGLVLQVWKKLEKLFVLEQLCSHRLVYDEITTGSKKQDILSKKIKPLRHYFETTKYNQALVVSDIVNKFPGLIDPNREKEQADPWLIAAAIERKKEEKIKKVYVVSAESEERMHRIPAVCRYFGIEHLNLNQFYKVQKWSFKMFFK